MLRTNLIHVRVFNLNRKQDFIRVNERQASIRHFAAQKVVEYLLIEDFVERKCFLHDRSILT